MKKFYTILLLLAPMVVKAQGEPDIFGVNALNNAPNEADRIVLKQRELRFLIARIINIALGFLGVVATLIILWGGFKWMTSGGNAEQVGDAKKLIGAGVVGLVIVLSSFAIATFVLTNLANATAGT